MVSLPNQDLLGKSDLRLVSPQPPCTVLVHGSVSVRQPDLALEIRVLRSRSGGAVVVNVFACVEHVLEARADFPPAVLRQDEHYGSEV